jgi:hypothetical protein
MNNHFLQYIVEIKLVKQLPLNAFFKTIVKEVDRYGMYSLSAVNTWEYIQGDHHFFSANKIVTCSKNVRDLLI